MMSRRWPIRACRWRRTPGCRASPRGMLDRQQARARKRGRKARSGEEGDLHRLRIALKKLRYTAEFFAPLYPKKKVRRYLSKLRGLQEHLGALNDIAHVRATVAELAARNRRQDESAPGERYAAGAGGGLVSAPAARASPNRR